MWAKASQGGGVAGLFDNMAKQSNKLVNWGKNVGWVGRQLTYNFTLPIVAAGAAATKWAFANEAANTRVRKVYGDLTYSTQRVKEETDALAISFRLLSDRFGVAQSEVAEIGAMWAQAGAAGAGLARSVRSTLEAMIIGEMDATEATEGLIAIQTAFRLNSKELATELARLNIIENQTGINFGGLIDVITRAGGAARNAGIDLRHLGAMAAALVPATGSAATAGNALRTIISRIVAPTQDTIDVLREMGIEVTSGEWQSANGVQRIEMMAEGFNALSDAQKNVVSSTVASRWQVSRFNVLMNDIASGTGYYKKALDATNRSSEELAETYRNELNAVLESNPQKFKIAMTQLQNALTDIIIPLLPAIVGVATRLADLAKSFSNLSPQTQQWILLGVGMLAILGPLAIYVGAVAQLFGLMGKTLFRSLGALFWTGNYVLRLLNFLGVTVAGKAISFFIVGMASIATAAKKAVLAAAGWFYKLLFVRSSTAVAVSAIEIESAAATTTAAIGAAATQTAAATGAAATQASAATGAALATTTAWAASEASQTRIWAMGAAQFGAATQGKTAWAMGAATTVAAAWTAASASEIRDMWIVAAQFAAATRIKTTLAIEAAAEMATAAIAASTTTTTTTLATIATTSTTVVRSLVGMSAAAAAASAAMLEVAAAFAASLIAMQTAMIESTTGVTAAIVLAARTQEGILIASGGRVTGFMLANGVAQEAIAAATAATVTATMGAGGVAAGAALTTGAVGTMAALPPAAGAVGTASGVSFSAGILGGLRAALVAIGAMFTGLFTRMWAGLLNLPIIGRMLTVITALLGEALGFLRVGIANLFRFLAASLTRPIALVRLMLLNMVRVVGAGISALAAFLGIPFWAAAALVAAVIAAIVVLVNRDFRDAILRGLQTVARGFAALPRVIANVFISVVRVIQRAVQTIVEWLSYLNPFARHSPSLVDNVRNGVSEMLGQYRRLAGIRTILANAQQATANFQAVSAGTTAAGQNAELNENIYKLAAGGAAHAIPAYRELNNQLQVLKGHLAALEPAIDRQSAVVDKLRDRVSALDDQLQEAKSKLEELANTDITGMREMSDQMFANEQAQKKLRLEILKLEQAGQSVDDLRSKLAGLEGEIEKMTADRTELRLAGAGSDILSYYDDQIAALEDQYHGLEQNGDAVSSLQDQLAKLQREGEILDLENSLKFDGPLRQIDQMVEGLHELPFDQIIRQIGIQQDKVADLEKKHAAANRRLEEEESILAGLQADYDAINDQVSNMETAISGVTGALDKATAASEKLGAALEESLSTAQEMFRAGEGQGFEIPGGDSLLGPEGDLFDIEEFNKQLQEELEEIGKGFGDLDIFKPLKDAWNEAWEWIKSHTPIEEVAGFITRNFSLEGMKNTGREVIDWFKRNFSAEGLGNIFSGIGEALGNAIDAAGRVGKTVWDATLGKVFSGIGEKLAGPFGVLQTVVSGAFGAIGMVVTWLWETILRPAWDWIYDTIIVRLIPIFQLFAAIVEINITMVGRIIGLIFQGIMWWINEVMIPAWTWLGEKIGGVWTAIGNVINFIWNVIIKPAWTLIRDWITNTLIPKFQALWEKVRSVWDQAGKIIKYVWDTYIGPVFRWIVEKLDGPVKRAFNDIKTTVTTVWDVIKVVTRNAWNVVATIIEDSVNFGIKAFNALARGINAVADALRISVHVDPIREIELPRLAKGGLLETDAVVGSGFKTQGAQAIVGEGKRGWPEFVIPTDPAYHGQANKLYDELGAYLHREPETGGILPSPRDIWNKGKDIAGNVVGQVAQGALKVIWNPIKAVASGYLNQIPLPFVQGIGKQMLEWVDNWVNGADENLGGALPPGGPTIDRLIAYLRSTGVPHRVTSTYRPGSITASGNRSLHAAKRAVDFAGPSPGYDTPALGAIFKAFVPIAAKLAELIYAGPQTNFNIKNGRRVAKYAQAQHHDHVHAAMAAGGMIATHGQGMNLMVGEGRYDEKVQVMPLREGGAGDSGTTIVINGNLEFPNVNDGSDADDFLRNLRALAE
jgi:TP901 family phage tail tape measure protein